MFDAATRGTWTLGPVPLVLSKILTSVPGAQLPCQDYDANSQLHQYSCPW